MRERIAEILWSKFGSAGFTSNESYFEAADLILALPSGMEAVKRCNWADKSSHSKFCSQCHGTGEIARNLSIGEAVEWAKGIATYFNNFVREDEYFNPKEILSANVGERVRIKHPPVQTS